MIAELKAIDDAVAGPLDATLDALIAEAPATDADQHAAADSSGL